jgi:hypothetical protein
MRASGDFRVLSGMGCSSLAQLRSSALRAIADLPQRRAKQAVAVVTIDLLNLWGAFSRAYVMSCIMRPRRANGGRVTVAMAGLDFNGVIGVAMRRHRPTLPPRSNGSWNRRDEPPWHMSDTFLNCCADLGCSHLQDVQAAMSLGSRVFDDLRHFRNFFAHRNEDTARKARVLAPNYSIPSYRHPIEILASSPFGRPHALLVDWIDDLDVTIELLCQ